MLRVTRCERLSDVSILAKRCVLSDSARERDITQLARNRALVTGYDECRAMRCFARYVDRCAAMRERLRDERRHMDYRLMI